MGLTTATIKNILLLLNFIFALLALVLIGFGVFILVSAANNEVDHGENLAGGLIITLGVVVLALALFGCLAVIRKSRRKLLIYLILLALLILIQLIMSSMTSVGTNDGLSGSVKEGFDMLWEIEKTSPGALAFYENWLHCCGVNGTEDYRNVQHPIPRTCCGAQICVMGNVYEVGCQAKFEEYLSHNLLTFSIVNWILIVIEIVAAILTWIMFSKLKNESRRSNTAWMQQ